MSSYEHDDLPRRPVSSPEPESQPVGRFPAVPPASRPPTSIGPSRPPTSHGPALPPPRPAPLTPPRAAPLLPPPVPQRPSPRRIVVSVPNWVLGGLAILAAVAGLLFIPALTPWSRAPVESPLDGNDPGGGVVGTGGPGAPGGSDRAVTPGAGPGPGVTASETPVASPAVTTTGPDGPATTTATVPTPQITGFATRPLAGGLIGYEIDVSVSNGASIAQTWRNASAYISGVPLVVTVVEPDTGVRAVLASGRVCVEPTDTATRNLDPDETQRVTVALTMVSLGQAPRQGTLDDGQCPASSAS